MYPQEQTDDTPLTPADLDAAVPADKALPDEHLFDVSTMAMEQEDVGEGLAYLGSAFTVKSLLLNLLRQVMEQVAKADTEENTMALITRACRHNGAIFLGKSPRLYAPVRHWNRPGSIDEHVARYLGSQEADALGRMEHGLVKFVKDCLDVLGSMATDNLLEEQWQPALDALLDYYTGIFLGMTPGTMAGQ